MKTLLQKLDSPRGRRVFVVLVALLFVSAYEAYRRVDLLSEPRPVAIVAGDSAVSALAQDALNAFEVKGRAPNNNYSRKEFGDGWAVVDGCDMRNTILRRDLREYTADDKGCKVLSGTLDDPYTGKTYQFIRGTSTSDDVQIDHVVALSDAWQKGAQQMGSEERLAFANDPLNLLAVDGPTNVAKGNSDAASWLPPNKSYRCRYVARQIAVKSKYGLWVTKAEYDALGRVLRSCPGQLLPVGGKE
jgi:hypothetical protein